MESILMQLPFEVRSQILGYLLPNLSEIKVFDGYYPYAEVFDTLAFDEFQSGSPSSWGIETHEAVRQRIRSAVQYRDDGEKCEIAILQVSHQLYKEGTAVMYNRAFRVTISDSGITFLKDRFDSSCTRNSTRYPKELWRSIQTIRKLRTFPFHMAKQVQIEYWADRVFDHKDILFHNLLSFCRVLQNKPSLKNIRIDLYDEGYRPKPSIANRDCTADTKGPCPPQDIFRGEILDGPFQRTEEEVNFWRQYGLANPELCEINLGSKLWEQAAGRELKSRRVLPGSGFKDTKGLEEALEPFKLLSNVGRAKINLTPGAKKKPEMVADAKMLEYSMMHEGRRDEVDLVTYLMKRCWRWMTLMAPSNP